MMNNITISDLFKMGDVNIIDIRSALKYNNNHIPRAHNIPFNNLISEPEKYLNKDSVYFIYCQKGEQSVRASMILKRRGYKIVNIIGGYESWILEDN